MLQRVFDERDAALRPAFAPLMAWAAADPHPAGPSLDDVLATAVEGYLRFLDDHPAFVALSSARASRAAVRLRSTPHASSAMDDAFRALRGETGWPRVRRPAVVVAFVSLCFFPLAHRDTFLPALGIDPDDPGFLDARRDQVVDVLLTPA